MSLNITNEVAALERMTVGEFQARYVEVFGEPVRSRHRQYLDPPNRLEFRSWGGSPWQKSWYGLPVHVFTGKMPVPRSCRRVSPRAGRRSAAMATTLG